jgi:DHA1 family bicyclomycin/chloramphenicol resistance-like MFS transporter
MPRDLDEATGSATPRGDVAGQMPPLWLLALITLSGTLAMHMFVPALPRAARELGASAGAMQGTVSVYILGLAVGQLAYGPLSDRYGRRPLLVAGLALYTAAGLVAALAPGVRTLLAARLVQALGGCAGLALGRAMVRDTAAPADAARRLALLNLMVTLGPGLAPLIGGTLSETFGWRSIFVALGALGAANIWLTLSRLPETGKRRAGVSAASLARDYGRLLRSPAFLGYAVGGGCTTTSLYAFLAVAPFVFVDELHRSPHEVGAYLALLIAGVSLGSVLASRLVTRIAIERLLAWASAAAVVAAFVLLSIVGGGAFSVPLILGPMFVFTVSVGLASPMALTKAMGVNPKVIGSAAGLYGFTQMAIGALCTTLAGLGHDPALAAASVLAAAGVVGQAALWTASRAEKTSSHSLPGG